MTGEYGQLLYTGYQYGRAVLDLYGVKPTEDHGHIVVTATRTGTKLSLAYILDDDILDDLGTWLDEQRSQTYHTSRFEARAERRAYDRQMAESDHLWRSF